MSRSYLFVPADSERKIAKAADTVADALILDLEDSVAPDARPAARELAAEFVARRDDAWVRINPIDSDDAQADLAAVRWHKAYYISNMHCLTTQHYSTQQDSDQVDQTQNIQESQIPA